MLVLDGNTVLRALRITFIGPGRSVRRVFWTTLLFSLLFLFSGFFLMARALDHVLFWRFRRQEVRAPVFIIGNPRSGTTFLHRLLGYDEERFTHYQLWQTILPTVFHDKMVRALVFMNRWTGNIAGRLLNRFERRVFRGWDGIHAVGLNRSEECEMLWVYPLFSPALYSLVPFPDLLPRARYLDKVPDRKRKRVMRYYRGILQRHLYCDGGKRTYLGKNVFFTGRLRSVMETFPDARFVHMVRHPFEEIPSFLSMFTAVWKAHSPDIPFDSPQARQFARVPIDYYKDMLEFLDSPEADRIITVRYDELVTEPRAVVERIYAQFDIPIEAPFRERLEEATAESRTYKSSHKYSLGQYGLDAAELYEDLKAVFERYGFEPPDLTKADDPVT